MVLGRRLPRGLVCANLPVKTKGGLDGCVIADLPQYTIFTYHPAYLARVKRSSVIDTLVREFVPLVRSTTKA